MKTGSAVVGDGKLSDDDLLIVCFFLRHLVKNTRFLLFQLVDAIHAADIFVGHKAYLEKAWAVEYCLNAQWILSLI